jgi:atypical dual specificity phosphatase
LDASGYLTCGQVTPQLYVGGELGPRDWEALSQEGVSAVVNLQHEQQDVWSPHERINGYLWLPAPDGMAPGLGQLMQGVDFMRAAIRSGQKVFVHCKAGQGRAPLLCACYLIAEGATPLEAIRHVREARPRTLLTPDQSARLREFAAHYAPDDGHLPAQPQPTLPATPPANDNAINDNTVGEPAHESTSDGGASDGGASEGNASSNGTLQNAPPVPEPAANAPTSS